MGTDSTELTFIRCPSCKSLVPAASPRCRMCGSALEASKKSAESDDAGSKKNNFQRARQHTINVNAEERVKLEQEESASKSAAQASKPASVKTVPTQQQPEPEFDNDSADLGDPLGAFLEEVAIEEEQKFSAQELDLSEEPEFAKENGSHSSASQEDLDFDDVEQEVTQQPKIKKTFTPNRELGAALRPRQPVKAALSFSKPKPVEDPVFAEDPEELVEQAQPQPFEPEIQEKPVAMARSVVRPPVSKPPASSEPKVVSEVKGRLFGWMVSYKDPKGTATELREGKFFLSRSSLKGSDLIIDDSSISTPHALFGVSSADGVKLQDLMSDRGVFVRKKGSETYQRMLESIKLEHGDWVRFGDVEFQIAIL